MKKVLRQVLVIVFLFSILVLPAAWPSEAAATTTLTNGWFYLIQNVHSGKFLEVANGNVVVGANVYQDAFYFDTTLAQIFCLKVAETDVDDPNYHQLSPAGNISLCMDVDNASDSDGANIKIFSSNSGYGAQSFKFIDNGDGSFCIQPYLSSTRVLGVANNSTANQANVELVSYNESDVHASQKWVLKKVNAATDPDYYAMNWSYFFRGADAESVKRISQRFFNANADSHYGTDIVRVDGENSTGKEIYSPCAGKVIVAGNRNSMGNFVIIETTQTDSYGNKLTIRLLHMRDLPLVAADDMVTADTCLGYIGNTGTSFGAHLHVDINDAGYKWGEDIRENAASLSHMINPEKFYPQIQFVYGPSDNVTYA